VRESRVGSAHSRFRLATALVALGALGIGFGKAASREICVDPAQGSPGTSVAIALILLDGSGVAAFQVDVRFDPTLLAYLAAQLGPDTSAGGWVLDSQILDTGHVRVLAYTFPPVGLSPGLKKVALMSFKVVAPSAIQGVPLPLSACILGDATGTSIPCVVCLQPGADGAAPRFALSFVDDGFAFSPATIVVEQGDWVLWRNRGTVQSHTTTSGLGCVQDGLWRGILSPGGRFCRQFLESSGTSRAYFSEPDCALGMTGVVEVTSEIQLALSEESQGTLLSWSGDGGRYTVYRSPAPSFVVPGTAAYSPTGGDAGTTYTDPESPPSGQLFYYLVVNSS
jgi:plastocyanin